MSSPVVTHPLPRTLVMLLPVLSVAVRLHAHGGTESAALTREMNCCVRIVSVAAARRGTLQSAGSDGGTHILLYPRSILR
jgi:hypothetical protein